MIYVKRYNRQEPIRSKRHFGLSAQESYDLELAALKRLKGLDYMCQLLDHDSSELTLSLEWAGHNVNYYIDGLKARKQQDTSGSGFELYLTKEQLTDQINVIFKTLEHCIIIHLAMGPWNFCVKDHALTLIDFGCVIIDGVTDFETLQHQLSCFLYQGSWRAQQAATLSRLLSRLDP